MRLARPARGRRRRRRGSSTWPTGRSTSPFGSLLLAATDAGLVRVAYEIEDHDAVLRGWPTRSARGCCGRPAGWSGRGRDRRVLRRAAPAFDLPLDLRLSTGFRRSVLAHLQGIGYGRTASYAAIATAAGSPKAVRAVGTACATNPVPIVVPCHRVLRSDGTVGQYLGGTSGEAAAAGDGGAAMTAPDRASEYLLVAV